MSLSRYLGTGERVRFGSLAFSLSRIRRPVRPTVRAVAGVLWIIALEVASPLLAVALAPLFYWRLLIDRPADGATLPPGDISELHYPYRRWVAEQFARGDNAFWNRFVGSGESAIGDIQFHVLYPPDALLARYFGPTFPLRALETGIIAHVALGALFMYLLGRRLTRSRVGGLVSAVVFAFGGYLSGFPVQQMILLETSVWLPAILLCIDIGADRGSLTPFALGAGALGLAALAGHPQTFFYVCGAAALYLAFKAWNGGRVRLVALLGLPVLFVGAVGLAAGALIPAYLYLGLTDRAQVTYAFSSTGFGLRELTGLVFPVEFGGEPLYNGVFTLVLVAVALMAPGRRAEKRFWLGFGLLGLLVSFGGNTFLESIQYLALGSFRFRDHERLAFYVGVSVAILAGFGAAELSRRTPSFRLDGLIRAARWPVVILVGFVGLLLALRAVPPGNGQTALLALADRAVFTLLLVILGWGILIGRQRGLLRPAAAGLLCVGLVAFDVFSTNWQTNLRPGGPNDLFPPSPLAAYVQSYGSGLFRVSSEGLLPGDGNAGMLYRLEDLVINSPLETSAYAAFDRTVSEWTRWRILNVRYIITERKLNDGRFQPIASDGKANLYEIDPRQRLPRVRVVENVVVAPSHRLALKLVDQVDVATTAVVEGPAPAFATIAPPVASGASATPPSPMATPTTQVTLVTDHASEQIVNLNLPRPGLLVVADAEQPGWNASIDGHPTTIYRADALVRGVVVPSGRHRVRFWFVPPGYTEGESLADRTLHLLEAVIVLDVIAQFVARLVIPGVRHYRFPARIPAAVRKRADR